MKTFFSASTRGFYLDGVHSDIPDDAVEITLEVHGRLMEQQASGLEIVGDTDGYPIAVERPPPDATQQAMLARRQRNRLLAASDARMLSDYPQTAAEQSAWKAYRQALRDVPGQPGFPLDILWPDAPVP